MPYEIIVLTRYGLSVFSWVLNSKVLKNIVLWSIFFSRIRIVCLKSSTQFDVFKKKNMITKMYCPHSIDPAAELPTERTHDTTAKQNGGRTETYCLTTINQRANWNPPSPIDDMCSNQSYHLLYSREQYMLLHTLVTFCDWNLFVSSTCGIFCVVSIFPRLFLFYKKNIVWL